MGYHRYPGTKRGIMKYSYCDFIGGDPCTVQNGTSQLSPEPLVVSSIRLMRWIPGPVTHKKDGRTFFRATLISVRKRSLKCLYMVQYVASPDRMVAA